MTALHQLPSSYAASVQSPRRAIHPDIPSQNSTNNNDSGNHNPVRPVKRLKLETGADARNLSQPPSGGEPSAIPLDRATSSAVPDLGGRAPWLLPPPRKLSNAKIEGLPVVEHTKKEGVEGATEVEAHETDDSANPPPLPIRPWKDRPSPRHPAGASHSKDVIDSSQVETTPYKNATPSEAPTFADKGELVPCLSLHTSHCLILLTLVPFFFLLLLFDIEPADFYPWVGTHPEDVLTEQTAKQGYYDRLQVSQNESNTARQSIYAQLKSRSGLRFLSTVFTNALEKRQANNRINAPSTFRPPPRVTLTDNKREAWLRDLANSSVSLRKLSRTIPHGIRGKVLLDQCLGKSIPIGRAIWLAKCVGANEIRAFKRKGTSAAVTSGLEAKWIKDWTAIVQQFVESVIVNSGDTNWMSKVSYA